MSITASTTPDLEETMATRGDRMHPTIPAPAAPAEHTIAEMRTEIDAIDAELVRLIQRRSEISHAIGAARTAEGGTRIVYSREMKVLDRFAVLGPAGTELGMLLLSLGRGQLGRR
jgi:chorismate mutase